MEDGRLKIYRTEWMLSQIQKWKHYCSMFTIIYGFKFFKYLYFVKRRNETQLFASLKGHKEVEKYHIHLILLNTLPTAL